MRLADVIGQVAAIALLRRGLRSGRLPHALLFQGPEQIGKGTTARALAAALLCDTGGEDACGTCASCAKIAARTHPDLLVLRRGSKKLAADELPPMSDPPDDEEEDVDLRPFIRVDQVRELTRHAAFAPREGSRRVFVIDPADRMNEAAQNALLKTLEEPPGQAVLLLVATRPHLLLPTVLSRCLTVRFAAMPVADLAARLEAGGMQAEEARARAAMASGRPGRALSLNLEEASRLRDEILTILEAFAEGDAALADLPDAAAAVAGRTEASLLAGLSTLEDLLREGARRTAGAGDGGDDRLTQRCSRVARTIGLPRSYALIEAIERVQADLRFNLNRTLAAEALLVAVAGGPLP